MLRYQNNLYVLALFSSIFLLENIGNISGNAAEKAVPKNVKLELQKPVAAPSRILLRGTIDMFSYAYKEAGITLFSNTLPNRVKNVIVGSPAYYASVKNGDKIVSANVKDNKLCLSIDKNGTSYYTEIRLSPQSGQGQGRDLKPMPAMIAIGFRYYMATGEVTYVDPNSDIFGKVHAGDKYMYLNNTAGTDPTKASMVYPVFKQYGSLHCYPCRQKPVELFAPDMTQKFKQEGLGPIRLP